MNKTLLFIPLVLFVGIGTLAFAQTQPATITEEQTVHAEIIIRDSQGNLVSYLQSYRFDINQEILDRVLSQDFETGEDVMGKSSVTVKDGKEYQVVKITTQDVFNSEGFRASDGILVDTESEENVNLIRFHHDGLPVIPGDTQTIVFTITKPL